MRVASAPGVGRLTRRPEFVAVAEGGRRVHTGRMTVQGRPREVGLAGPSGYRVGLTLTKRVGHATERNRIRRRLRAAAAEVLAGRAPDAMDVVVIGRRDGLSAAFDILVEDLRRALGALTKPIQGRPASGEARRGAVRNPLS